MRFSARNTHGRAVRRQKYAALDKEFDVNISYHGILRRLARVHTKVALKVVIPVEEIGLKADSAVKRYVRRLGTGEVEVGEGSAAAYGGSRDVVWMRGEPTRDIEDTGDMDGAAAQHLLRIDGPEADGAVGMTETDPIGIDPGEATCFHGVLICDA